MLDALREGDRVVVSDQEKNCCPDNSLRQRAVKSVQAGKARVTPTLHIALRFSLFHRKRAFMLSLCWVVLGLCDFQFWHCVRKPKVLTRFFI